PFLMWLLVVSPLLPLPPREVCRRFPQVPPERDLQRYTTNNLSEAVKTVAALKASGRDRNLLFELTDETPLPFSADGYLVGCRIIVHGEDGPMKLAALFHLVKLEGAWKIEDVYLVGLGDVVFSDW